MRLYIVRHGKALQESPTGLDRDRILAPRGHAQARWLAAELSSHPIEAILASPYPRAWATAEHLGVAIGLAPIEEPRLECGEPAPGIIPLLESAPADRLVIVGHNPQLSDLVGMLARSGSDISLRTGEAIAIDWPGDLRLRRGEILASWRLDDE